MAQGCARNRPERRTLRPVRDVRLWSFPPADALIDTSCSMTPSTGVTAEEASVAMDHVMIPLADVADEDPHDVGMTVTAVHAWPASPTRSRGADRVG